jgi:hypothetical protein
MHFARCKVKLKNKTKQTKSEIKNISAYKKKVQMVFSKPKTFFKKSHVTGPLNLCFIYGRLWFVPYVHLNITVPYHGGGRIK